MEGVTKNESGMTSLTIRTTSRCEMIDITERVAAAIRETGIKTGICRLFVPHTTAAVTINENADPDVQRDILAALDRIVPLTDHYRHAEGNAAAHVKASLFAASSSEPMLRPALSAFRCGHRRGFALGCRAPKCNQRMHLPDGQPCRPEGRQHGRHKRARLAQRELAQHGMGPEIRRGSSPSSTHGLNAT